MVKGKRGSVKWGGYLLGPSALRKPFGNNGLGVSPSHFGGSSFLSISAQPELIERDPVGLLTQTSQRDHLQGIFFGVVLFMARIYFLAASLKLHGLNE